MRLCTNCKREIISAGPICGRLSCQPSPAGKKAAMKYVESGYRGQNTRRVSGVGVVGDESAAAPPSKVFDFWACVPSSWPYLGRGLQDIQDIRRRIYRAPHGVHEFRGRLSNGKTGRYGTTVKFSPWNALAERILTSDDVFTQQACVEQERVLEARDEHFAAQVRYGSSNFDLYLRDKRAREVANAAA